MNRSLPRAAATLALVVSAVLLTACSGGAAPAPTTSDAAPAAPVTSAPTPTPTQSTVPAAVPTCDTLISTSTVTTLKGYGWTAKSEPMRIGATVFDKGIQCTWGDYTIATDHVQIYGWAPISADDARAAQQELVQTGWRREESPEGVYVTESQTTAISPDAQGYGLTYLFGDGWVKYADTKQSLLLIEWPKS
ncbi:hypothetical protein [Microbacterium sp. CJ88]|uniref:hypothetical protein n=1 Tax=Microbacterium sp. CJ88 TaxID=3445672 RepID=UPI003F65BDFA